MAKTVTATWNFDLEAGSPQGWSTVKVQVLDSPINTFQRKRNGKATRL